MQILPRVKPFHIAPDPWWVRSRDYLADLWTGTEWMPALCIGLMFWVGASLVLIGLLLVV
jgi:hypothetical protein